MNNNLDNLVTLCRPCHARRHGQTNDREDVREMRMMGMSLGEIGRKLKVSRQRIYQIIRKQKDWENIESAFWRHKDPIDKR
jgi:DNA invertase Pin-like site-specific DNA recombinase